ncbi:hypothetical protein T4B_2213 [Trichinella pseudospiralis]|uniref:Uncharacterized protein n=1 Tax=Trichinella pseudospiralis TaxID=6337 RepID=A0A0V1J584_TRIPS|nr:hypothetical protein T4B_2213 [Trichinella pseudospiralis]
MNKGSFVVFSVLRKKKLKTMPHPPTRGHSSHWQKFILERVLLQSVYIEDAKKLKETLDSVSAQLQVVYQQKLRLQKNLKEKIEAEEQLQNDVKKKIAEAKNANANQRISFQRELENMKQQLKELQKDFEALESTKNNLATQLNFEKAECQEKLNNLTFNIPSNGKPATNNDTSTIPNQEAT